MEPQLTHLNYPTSQNNAQSKEFYIGEQTFKKLLYTNDYPSKQLQHQLITKLPAKQYYQIVNLMKKVIKTSQEIQYTASTAHFIINVILHYGFGEKLLSAYLEVLGYNKASCKQFFHIESIKALLPYIPDIALPNYCYTFQLQIPNPQRVFQLGSDLISQNYEREALKLAEISKNIQLFYMLLKTSKLKKKKIYSSIRKSGMKPEQCPEIYRETLLSSMRHWMGEGYEYLQEVFGGSWEILAIGLNKPAIDGDINALCICKRNPEIIKYFNEADQSKINKKLQNLSKYIPNPLQTDIFGPSNPHKHFNLKDYKITEEQVKFITDNQKSLNFISEFIDKLSQTKKIGIDTESKIALSALDPHSDLLEIIQIAIDQQIYLIDVKARLESQELKEAINTFVSSPNHQIIGHTTQEDVSLMWRGLVGHKSHQLIKCQIIDVAEMYKQIFKTQKCSLAFICQHLFKKQLCKKYTITNWSRRPLLKNQVHYAALDAFIVLKIREQLELISKNAHEQ